MKEKDEEMKNIPKSFECEINDLGYNVIEQEIANHFKMGMPDNSSLPVIMKEDEIINECILNCSDKSGTFSIRNIKVSDGRYLLFVTLKGNLS